MDMQVEGTTIDQDAIQGSITWMNLSGDITIVWDEQNKEKILEVVRKKMAEGYTFFSTKSYLFGKIKRKSEVTNRDLNRGKIEDIIITDEQFERMVQTMNDADVATLVRGNAASLAKRKGKSEMVALERAKTPEDVVKPGRDSVAVRPIRGG